MKAVFFECGAVVVNTDDEEYAKKRALEEMAEYGEGEDEEGEISVEDFDFGTLQGLAGFECADPNGEDVIVYREY